MMKTILIHTLLALLIVVAGCMSTAPSNNQAFTKVTNLEEFVGLYRNLGDGGKNSHKLYLSRIIWSDDEEMSHEEIDLVRVTVSVAKTLLIGAYSQQSIVKEQEFVEGVDFKITGGRVILDREGGVAGLKGGEPLLGLYYGSSEIGLDIQGNAKFYSSGAAAGMAFLVIPIVAGGDQTVKFIRIE